jgi:protein-tyrosine-phosphatase
VPEVLFICTGNLNRSPSAAWFLRQRLSVFGPRDVTVASAGTQGSTAELPAPLVEEGEAFGLNLAEHVSTKMDEAGITRADLIIGMAREHVREVVLVDNAAFYKTFTLREIVRRGQERGARGSEESIQEWLLGLNAGRRHMDLIGDSPQDDTPDPMGGPPEEFRAMLAEMEALTTTLYGLLWPRTNPNFTLSE